MKGLISAVFEHKDGYRYEQTYASRKKFLGAVSRLKDATFLHATDYARGVAVWPSNLWDYRNLIKD